MLRRELFGFLAAAPAMAAGWPALSAEDDEIPKLVTHRMSVAKDPVESVRERVGVIAGRAVQKLHRTMKCGPHEERLLGNCLELEAYEMGHRHFAVTTRMDDPVGLFYNETVDSFVGSAADDLAVAIRSAFGNGAIYFRELPLAFPGLGVFQACGSQGTERLRATLSYDPRTLCQIITLDVMVGPAL